MYLNSLSIWIRQLYFELLQVYQIGKINRNAKLSCCIVRFYASLPTKSASRWSWDKGTNSESMPGKFNLEVEHMPIITTARLRSQDSGCERVGSHLELSVEHADVFIDNGVYAGIRFRVHPMKLVNWGNNFDSNCRPWHVVEVTDDPEPSHALTMKERATLSAVII